MKNITIIVPTKNHREYVVQLIRQLHGLTDKIAGIIFVDRSSTDGTAALIEQSGIGKLISVDHNDNYGAALNAAIEHTTSDVLIFLRPDVILPESDWLKSIQKAFDTTNINIASIKMIDFDGNPILTGLTYDGLGNFNSIGVWQNVPDGHKLLYASETCIVFKKSFIESFDLFDSKLKENFTYVDFILRSRKSARHSIVDEVFNSSAIDLLSCAPSCGEGSIQYRFFSNG